MTALRRFLELAAPAALVVAALAGAARAQDVDVKRYAVDVRLEQAANAATVRTTFALANLGDTPRRQLQFRVNAKSDVRSVTAGGQAAAFTSRDDTRFRGLKIVSVDLPAAVPARATTDVTVETRLVLESGDPDAVIVAGETVLLPTSTWVPLVNTQFAQFGPSTAPFTLTVGGAGTTERPVSGGTLAGSTFTQPLYSLPFLISGAYGAPVAREAGGISFEAWLPEGAGAQAREGADRLLDEAAKIAAFYAGALGAAPRATFRIVASDRAAGFADPSGVALGRRVFERRTTDAETFELLADAVARVWLEGSAPIRGSIPPSAPRAGAPQEAQQRVGAGLVRDALPRYLALLALGDRYGAGAEAAAYGRLRDALSNMGVLASQIQLGLATPADPSYWGLMRTKGPLVLRLLEREVGREQMLGALRAALESARSQGSLTPIGLRQALTKAAGRDLSPLYATWIDTAAAPDLIVGVPQQTGGAWVSALRNLGTGDVTVEVVATTESGKRLTTRASVPSEGFSEARFETTERVTTVEVDPDRIVPQQSYANDARPPRPARSALFAESVEQVKRGEFGPAEAKLRQLVADDPTDAVAKAWLARALLGLGRPADAERAAGEALATEPVPLEASTWANYVAGQTALAAGRQAEAVDRFRRAAANATESSALRLSREALFAAERAAGQPPSVDASVAKFFAEFDRAVSAGVNTAQAKQFVDPALLPDFVRGLVTSVARTWRTEVVRTDLVGRDEAVVDARFTLTSGQQSSTAVAVARLRRDGDSWRIVEVQILETT